MAKVAKTTWWEAQIINILRGQSPSIPSALYLALFTTNPGESASGSEVSGGAYQRQAITFGAPTPEISPATGSKAANTNQIQTAPATAAWGNVGYIVIYDAAVGGNALYYGPISTPKTVGIGDRVTFDVGAITILED